MPRSTIPALVLATITFAAPAWAARQSSDCDVHREGAVDVESVVVPVRKKPRTQFVRNLRRDTAANTQVQTFTVRQANKTVTELVVEIASDGSSTLTRRYGFGFKGIHEVVARRAGDTVTLTADGHPVSIAALHASPPAVVFEDGSPAPKVKVKSSVRRLLKKTQKVANTVTCPGFGATARTAPAAVDATAIHPAGCNPYLEHCGRTPFEQRCYNCEDKCGAKATACVLADVAVCAATAGIGCGVEAIVSFFDDDVDCVDAVMQCDQLCHAIGHDCCEPSCGSTCCQFDDLNDIVCVGATATSAGKCCTHEDACGPTCCGVTFPSFDSPGVQTVCMDAAKGLCCIPGQSTCGNKCCDSAAHCANPATGLCCAGDGCGDFCCPVGQRCVSPSNDDPDLVVCQACPADKTGPVCGSTCCGPNEVCDFKSGCCNENQLCGGECCDAAHCLNGTTCCKQGTACGSQCCDGIGQTCCNGACCNGQCVGAVGGIGGICCPENRSCGPTCCAADNYCANSQTGLCIQCPPGDSPCGGSENGGPTCCRTGQECCATGCCQEGTICCQTVNDSQPGCHSSSDCVR